MLRVEGGEAFVEFQAFSEDETGAHKMRDWVRLSQICPTPPPAPPDFLDKVWQAK